MQYPLAYQVRVAQNVDQAHPYAHLECVNAPHNPRSRNAGTRGSGALDGHLLQERHQVHRRLGGLQDAHHGLRLIVD
ncbi:hypothetical protein ACWEQ8_42740, partial [Streptomyces noursei]